MTPALPIIASLLLPHLARFRQGGAAMSNRGTFVGFYGSWGSGIAQAARNCSGGTSSARRKRNNSPSQAAHSHQTINGKRSGLWIQKGRGLRPRPAR